MSAPVLNRGGTRALLSAHRRKALRMTRTSLDNDCFAGAERILRHDEAIEMLAGRIEPVKRCGASPLAEALGRIVVRPVVARHPVPMHTNSAVDGYAFRHADVAASPGKALPVVGIAAAGHSFSGPVPPASAVRIFTGATVPADLDTVAMQEETRAPEGRPSEVVIPAGLTRGANIRHAGEDVAEGAVLIEAGTVLRPQELAALASIGHERVEVYDRVRVAIVSTGDEIVRPGARPLRAGEVFDANAPMLAALATTAGAQVTDLGVWPDDRAEVERRLAEAATRFDVILTSGGASHGAEDHIAASLAALGTRHVWSLAIKPGRPVMFGQIRSASGSAVRDTLMVGLPGNPVAAFVCTLMYVFPMLRRLGGAAWPKPRRFQLPADFEVRGRKTGRREFLRGTLLAGLDGLKVAKYSRDGSGLISGLRAADGLIDVPEDRAEIRRGDPVAFIPFTEFGILGQ